MRILVPLQELHHRHVVEKAGGGTNDLVKIGRVRRHLLEGFVQLLRASEVMKGEDNRGFASQLVKLGRSHAGCGLDFHVHQLTTGISDFSQQIQLR